MAHAESKHAPHTNRLIHEDSPYLQQHAHNPIDWYPWSQEAFDKAKKEDKLIFLSVGYATCHWCHVMERESFENEEIARYMNAHYVNIKVDREELPHIDRYYQDVYMLLNKRAGGWPLTIIMTPDRKPFYAATYLPPFNRYGRPGLLGMAQYLYETFRDKRENVYKSADSIVDAMENIAQKKERLEVVDADAKEVMARFVSGVATIYDAQHKGVGDAPKFPHATTLQTLLTVYRIDGNDKALQMATEALEAMAKGGIYDQIEGGFYRYSVDAAWMVPHFEKMLYTNAELLECYSEAYRIAQKPLFARIVEETVANMDARFLKEGLYYSASDADSDAEEGKYFVFDYQESYDWLRKHGFGADETKALLAYFHITPEGNFEGKSNPYIGEAVAPERLREGRDALFALRQERNYPFIDYKIQTSWNALLAKGLFAAAIIDDRYGQKGLEIVDNLLKRVTIEGRLYHQVVLSNRPKVEGYLEDYAFLCDALVSAYQFTFDMRYLQKAQELAEDALKKFYRGGKWYMSSDDFPAEASLYDTSYRSALAVMMDLLLKLAALQEDQKGYARAEKMITAYSGEMMQSPQNFPTYVRAYLGEKLGWTVLKIPQHATGEKRRIEAQIRYPFALLKPYEGEKFLACKIDRCFANSTKMEDIVKKVQ